MDTSTQDESEALKTIMRRNKASIRTAVPGRVQSFNAAEQTVTVTPVIRKFVTLDDEQTTLEMPPVVKVPLVFPYAQTAGFALTIPISKGDMVLLVIADRSIDNWVQFSGIQNPVEDIEPRMHDITDSLAVVGATPIPLALPDYQTASIEMRNRNRSTRVTVTDDEVQIRNTAGASITLNDDGSVRIDSPTQITQCAPTMNWITDNINVSPKSGADVEANMFDLTLRVKDLITPQVSSYNGHTHPGDSGGTTGTPNP